MKEKRRKRFDNLLNFNRAGAIIREIRGEKNFTTLSTEEHNDLVSIELRIKEMVEHYARTSDKFKDDVI